jgi:hypothetical protein
MLHNANKLGRDSERKAKNGASTQGYRSYFVAGVLV